MSLATQGNQLPHLPDHVTSRVITVGDLDMHILECPPPNLTSASAAHEDRPHLKEAKPPLVILLHGFPELAYSWRKVMLPLAQAGFHVVAPDQRGFGLTKPHFADKSDRDAGAEPRKITYEDDIEPYRMLNLTGDIIGLIYALGYKKVAAVVGHDFGTVVAGWCALIRPDLVDKVVIMSAPFTGPLAIDELLKPREGGYGLTNAEDSPMYKIDRFLRTTSTPRRKHYTMYNSSKETNEDLSNPPEGLHRFLRNYYHVKSADWDGHGDPGNLEVNMEEGISSWEAIARAMEALPQYYVLPYEMTMPEVVGQHPPTQSQITNATWLTEEELSVYTEVYKKTGFQGGLNWYRTVTDARWNLKDMKVFMGKKIEVPLMFVAGRKDWGTWQTPGAVAGMRSLCGKNMKDEHFVIIEGAGHWVQQEQPEETVRVLLNFFCAERS